jgi:translocator assembly and maintenance protein 41
MIKYGVVSRASLENDLRHWTSLYIAGRLHKPVATLASNPSVEAAQRINVASALRIALLLLPQRFTARDLYSTICTLSYAGDVRMGLAEDDKKVDRIVEGR